MLDKTIIALTKRQNQITTEISRLESEVNKLNQAIKVLSALTGRTTAKGKPAKKRGKMSTAGKARIRAAQKKRWAEWKAANK